MYRCYLLRNGRIVRGDDLTVDTLENAIAEGRHLLATRARTGPFSGMEIWRGGALIYSDRCHTGDTGSPAAIDSPFATPESTILPNWRPTAGRPIGVSRPAAAPDVAPAAEDADALCFALLRKLVRRKPILSLIAA